MGTPVFKEYTGKPPKFSAVQLTVENIRDIAAWMGADSFTVSENIVGGDQFVKFGRIPQRPEKDTDKDRFVHPCAHHEIGRESKVGDWIVRIDDDRWGNFEVRNNHYVIVDKADFDDFLKENIDSIAAPYDR